MLHGLLCLVGHGINSFQIQHEIITSAFTLQQTVFTSEQITEYRFGAFNANIPAHYTFW